MCMCLCVYVNRGDGIWETEIEVVKNFWLRLCGKWLFSMFKALGSIPVLQN